MIILFISIAFLCGSLMFSYWLGLAVNKDITKVGDGNPGAFNLWHATGYKLGILGVFLDFAKGYLPIAIMMEQGFIDDSSVVQIGLAPILGHAFSPFMKFRGGKSIAVTFGVWSAVSRFKISIAYAIILAILLLIVKILNKGEHTTTETDGVMVVLGMYILGIYMIVNAFPDNFMILWLGNSIILTYKNKNKLYTFFKAIYNKHEGKNTTTGL